MNNKKNNKNNKNKIILITSLSIILTLVGCSEDGSTNNATDTTQTLPDTTDTTQTLPDTTDTAQTTPDTTVSDIDANDPPRLTPADFCVPQAEILCAQAFSCGCPTPDSAQSEATCVESRTAACLESFAEALEPLASGVLVLLADEIAKCNEALTAAVSACDLPSNQDIRPACGRIMSSVEALGGPCEFPVCASGAGVCVDGTCAPLPALSAACSTGVCADGLACIEGVCRENVALNSPCTSPSECALPARCIEGTCQARKVLNDSCISDYECGIGLRCIEGACADVRELFCASTDICGENATCLGTADRTCLARGVDGATCTYTEDCADGFYCAEGICRANPGEAEACADGVYCASDLGCDFESSICSTLPPEGEPCSLGPFGPMLCAEGLACINGTCGAIPGENETCAMNNLCAAGLGCDFKPDEQGNSSICRTRKDAGALCENDDICDIGLFCDYGVGACAPFYALGDLCRVGNECGPQRSCMPITPGARTFTCQPLPGEGDACFLDCAAGTRCQTTEVQAECAPLICRIVWP